MSERCNTAIDIVRSLLRGQNESEQIVEETLLDEYIDKASMIITGGLNDDERETVRKSLHHMFLVRMNPGIKIVNVPDYKDWYNSYDIEDEKSYWNRYKFYLSSKLAFPNRVIDAIDQSTTDIVNLLGKPDKDTKFSRKGLVIGDVQSGKTANYISVINKAADAGYKVIVLLTGTIEKLRQQTQARIDEGFIGIDTSAWERGEQNLVGVGLHNPSIRVGSFTSVLKDFNKSLLKSSNISTNTLNVPCIIVAKKNKTVLNSIYKWFNRENKDIDSKKINESLLFIDDEADNASINTNSLDNDPTSINKCIRRILNLFMRSSYVGYTATPYANVFIEPNSNEEMENEDLFPKDYIYVLEPPNNYIGAREIYSDDGKYTSMYREIDDFESFLPVKHKKDYELPLDLPLSLKKAILSFCIANTIRDIRGDVNAHRSMLINVSRYIRIQDDLKDRVNAYFIIVKNQIQNYILNPDYEKYQHLALLKKVYEEEFKIDHNYDETPTIDWDCICSQIFDSIKNIKVESVNGGNASKLLDYKGYKNGLRLIAIGGMSLSRGLTLEGLCISYFYRKSIMYDTLMQMGRWFGYRSNYEDLCQIWMSEESYSWYQHISAATDELREEINRIYYSNLTPMDVGIKVRSSEGTLIVTARNKMRSAGDFIADISLSGNYIETPHFSKSDIIINDNIEEVKELLKNLENDGYSVANPSEIPLQNKTVKQVLNVDKKYIIKFLKSIYTHYKNIKFDAHKIAELLENNTEEILDNWDIAFPNGKSKGVFHIMGESIKRVERTFGHISGSAITLKKYRLGSPSIVASGLTEDENKEYERIIINNRKKRGDYNPNPIPTDKEYFDIELKRNPLLVIYLIDLKPTEEVKLTEPLVGLGIGIPRLKKPQELSYSYKVNKKWLQENYDIDDDEFEADDIGGYDA